MEGVYEHRGPHGRSFPLLKDTCFYNGVDGNLQRSKSLLDFHVGDSLRRQETGKLMSDEVETLVFEKM